MTFRYPEAVAHGGRLKYRGPIPVLTVEGTPEQIGRQVGELALRPAARILDYPLDYLRSQIRVPGLPLLLWALMKRKCRELYANIPKAYQAEIAATAGACPDRGRLIPANTLFDMSHMGLRPLFGCSSVIVPPHRSETGGVLFGRNLDFFPLRYLHEFSLVTAYRPATGRLGFASLGFPAVVGCFSGMNEAGLSLARHEVLAPKVPRTYDPAGVPFAVALRSVMETCRTTDEAVAYLKHIRHATVNIVMLADADSARIVEMTPKATFDREVKDELTGCSNHFVQAATANPSQTNAYGTVDRLSILRQFSATAAPILSITDVWAGLAQVHQGELTLQTMVFEPGARAIHVAFGSGPTTGLTSTRIDLDATFASRE